ncbi:clathrin assembly protein AP178 [Galdieria sulphuraria]|uniref:Clathrin assembly protein AP178 n=1 Tax=Galdieria sulphuraria TaxID=130081 RepID=M2Y1Z4_GALSU|nr:clathrin assembly protein AP178 [Galdieria sulphuraria]EME29978.1 clathrin assembly protein AP178 [Galdieria sulphuraria]|eukprot:XP_005706498.1 clathrin assembly protein AP178 [Galdieria sulphuraria]
MDHILLDEGSGVMVDFLPHSPFIFNLQEFHDALAYTTFLYITLVYCCASYDTIRDAIRKKEKALFIQENEIIPSGQIVTFELMQVLKVKPTLENQEHRKKLIFAFLKIVITGYPD